MKPSHSFWHIFLVSSLFLVAILPVVSALELSGTKLSPIIYRSGATITNHYTISGTNAEVDVNLDPGPFQGITVTEVVDNEFDLIIYFSPEQYIAPGSYSFGLSVKEKPAAGAGAISSLVAVSKIFTVEVYSYDKEIDLSLDVPNINAGSPLSLQLTVISRGYPDINSVFGEITILNADAVPWGTIRTEEKFLPGLSAVTFTEVFDASSVVVGNYAAAATVFYDGQQESANTTFLIGNMDILVRNYTSTLPRGFADFNVVVVSNWGNVLRNVYAKLFIAGQELLQTPSLDLLPWQEAQLQGILKVDLVPGGYNGTLQLFFEGEHKDIPIIVTIIELPAAAPEVQQPASSTMVISIILIILLLAVVVLVYFLFHRRHEKNKGRSRSGGNDDF